MYPWVFLWFCTVYRMYQAMKKSLPKYDFCNVVGWSVCKYIKNMAKIIEIDNKKNQKNVYKH